jgi:RNA polymerase sigma-70 factor (ECF subfamily)
MMYSLKPDELQICARRQSPELDFVMSVDSNDRSLVLRAQSGERSAFSALVHKYRHRVMKLSMRYARNRADAEDEAQNTFLRAHAGLLHFRGDTAFYAWRHRVAVNSAKTVLSLRTHEAAVSKSDTRNDDSLCEPSVLPKEMDTPEDLALTDEICDAVNAAIEGLSEGQRTSVVLREFQCQSYSQVATVMTCPVGTVRSRMFLVREPIDLQFRHVVDDGLGRARRTYQARPYRDMPGKTGGNLNEYA